MSHVSTIDLHITDLSALAKAANDCGMMLHLGQTTYAWYGKHVGDYPLPAGFKASELGKCEHAISLPVKGSYECGVVKRRDGKPGYTLLWDFWAGGEGLEAAIGKDGVNLRNAYAARVSENKLRAKGYRVTILKTETGLRVRATK